MYACFCGSIIQCVVKQPTFAPCHLLFYLTDVAGDMNNMPWTLTKIDTMIVFALHLCLLCWHGNPLCGEAPCIMNNAKLCYWYFESTLSFLIWNWMELTAQLPSLFIHVQNLSSLCLFQGDMPDGMHKSPEGCETNPTYIAAKKAKTSWR